MTSSSTLTALSVSDIINSEAMVDESKDRDNNDKKDDDLSFASFGDKLDVLSDASSFLSDRSLLRRSSRSDYARTSMKVLDGGWECFNQNMLEQRQMRLSTYRWNANKHSISSEENGNSVQLPSSMSEASLSEARRWERRFRPEVFDKSYVKNNKDINEEIEELCLTFRFKRGEEIVVQKKRTSSTNSDIISLRKSVSIKSGQKESPPSGRWGPASEKERLNKLKCILSKDDVVVLKQGPIMLDERGIAHDWFLRESDVQQYELSVLTTAFIICDIKKSDSGEVTRKLKHCDEIQNIVSVMDIDFIDNDFEERRTEKTNGFQVIVQGFSHAFICVDDIQKLAWIKAFEFAIMNQEKYRGKINLAPGWNHLIMRTSIHSAAWCGDDEMLEIILDCADDYASIVDVPDAEGFSPIHYAILQNNVSCLTLLLECGCDVNKLSSQFMSPAKYCELGDNFEEDVKRAETVNEMLKLLHTYGAKEAASILKKNEKIVKSVRYSLSKMALKMKKMTSQRQVDINLRSSKVM